MLTSVTLTDTGDVRCKFSVPVEPLIIEANMYDDIKSLNYFVENWSRFEGIIDNLNESITYKCGKYMLTISADFSNVLSLHGPAHMCWYIPGRAVRFFVYDDFTLAKIGPYVFSTTYPSCRCMSIHAPPYTYLGQFNGRHVDEGFDTYRAEHPYTVRLRYEYLRKGLGEESLQLCIMTKLI